MAVLKNCCQIYSSAIPLCLSLSLGFYVVTDLRKLANLEL